MGGDFPSFSEGLSLRGPLSTVTPYQSPQDFPSFSEGLSLREGRAGRFLDLRSDFPSFSEGLSLRDSSKLAAQQGAGFPFLFGGAFIEGRSKRGGGKAPFISLPFRRGFH